MLGELRFGNIGSPSNVQSDEVPRIPTIGVVILYYRNWPVVTRTLASVTRQSLQPVAVLVVDNASGDQAAQQLVADGVTVLSMPRNLGYAGGMRAGIDAMRSRHQLDAVLLLTHEVQLDDDALEQLVAELAVPGTAMVGPALALPERPDIVYTLGGLIDPVSGFPVHRFAGRPIAAFAAGPAQQVDWLDGCALLVDTDAWDRTGGFDDGFFMYCEDAEFGVRCTRLGYRVTCVPGATALAAPADTVSEYIFVRSGVRFLARTGRRRAALDLATHAIAGAARDVVLGRGRAGARARILGAVHAYTGQFWPRLLTVKRDVVSP